MRPLLLPPEAGCFPGMRHRWYVFLPWLSLHDLLIEIFRDLMIALYRGQKIDFIIHRYIHGVIKCDDYKALCVILKAYQLTVFVNSLVELVLVGDSRTFTE